MPNPIGGNRPGGIGPSIPTTPAAPTVPATPATPATPTTPTGFTGGSSRLDQWKGKALDLAVEELASSHNVSTSFGAGLVQGNVKLSEEIALSGTRTFDCLVGADRRRSEHAASHPDAVWASTSATVGASASFPLGVGAAFGFGGSVEATTLLVHDVSGTRDAAAAVKESLKSLKLPHDTESLQKLNAAPGSEFMLRGIVSQNAGIGTSVTLGTGVATASAGASVGGSSSQAFTKQLKVLENDTVYFQLTQTDAQSAGINVGVTAGTNLPGAVGNVVDRALRFRVAGEGHAGSSDKVMGAVVLDLKTPQGAAALDYLMKASPAEGAAYIQQNHLGATYTGTSTNVGASLDVRFGSVNLLASSTTRNTSNGVIEEPGGTTLLSTADYGRDVGGVLPRLFMGEERSVSVKAGELTKGGVTQRAVGVSLTVKDTELKGNELEQYRRFGEAMGAPLVGLPAAAGHDLGKAKFTVQVAITNDDIARLSQWQTADVALAFASAQKDIEGGALPPWFANPQEFEQFRRQYNAPPSGRNDVASVRARLSREYERQTGRDLSDDLSTAKAVELIGKKLDQVRGKPVEEWGGVLEAIGKQSSADVRAAVLAMNRMAGAQLVNLTLEGRGFNAIATPQATTPRALQDVVGEVMAPPG
jgi:hypothetical protein